jgi:hypothetical protein
VKGVPVELQTVQARTSPTTRKLVAQKGDGIPTDSTNGLWVRSIGALGSSKLRAQRAVAVKFRNGTMIDLIKVYGSPDYISASKTLETDAKNVKASKPSSL